MALVCSTIAVMFTIVPREPDVFGQLPPDLGWAAWCAWLLAAFFWIRALWLHARRNLPSAPVDGLEVLVRVTFTGLAGVPLLALGKNSLAPNLRLGETHVFYDFGARRAYDEIRLVNVMILPHTNNLMFTWKGSPFSFTANVVDRSDLIEALRWLRKRNVPFGRSARTFMQDVVAQETGLRLDESRDPPAVRRL